MIIFKKFTLKTKLLAQASFFRAALEVCPAHKKVFLAINEVLRVQVSDLFLQKILCLGLCEIFTRFCGTVILLCIPEGCKKDVMQVSCMHHRFIGGTGFVNKK